MINYIVYDLLSGEILKTGNAPESAVQAQASEGQGVIEGKASDSLHCIDTITQQCKDKTQIPYVLSVATLSDLPRCKASIEGQTTVVDDGVLNINIDVPGTYNVLLTSPVYLDTTVQVII